jgi:hypothetical protein
MADYTAQLQLSCAMIVLNAEMNFNLRSRRQWSRTQDAHAQGAHVRQEADGELIRWTQQDAPIGGAPGAASPFGRLIIGQLSNRIFPGRPGKLLARGGLLKLSTNC